MTTIAWDGKTMAADKQSTSGGMKYPSHESKIHKGGVLAGQLLYTIWENREP